MGKSSKKSPKKKADLRFFELEEEMESAAIVSNIEDKSDADQLVTLSTVRELLKVQESVIKTMFDSVVKSLSERVDGVVKTVESIKSSLEFTQKDLADLQPVRASLAQVSTDVKKLDKDLSSRSLSLEYLENQSRRNNIRVNGIPESPKETWEEAESKVKVVVKSNLGIDLDIERVVMYHTSRHSINFQLYYQVI